MPFPSPGDLPDPGMEPMSPVLVDGFFTAEPPGKSHLLLKKKKKIIIISQKKLHLQSQRPEGGALIPSDDSRVQQEERLFFPGKGPANK